MSKKHFIALADAIQPLRGGRMGGHMASGHDKWDSIVSVLADFCQSQNPRFNRDRWIAYVNGEGGPNGGRIK